MTGFYSKDFILESAYGQFYFSGTVVYFIATIGAIFTTLYSVKVLSLTFLTNPNGPRISYKKAHEGDIFMSIPAGWGGMSSIAGKKLSNSGDTLKLLMPNLSRSQTIGGWINYSGMAISQNKMTLRFKALTPWSRAEKWDFFSRKRNGLSRI